jgi:hypothetical protein
MVREKPAKLEKTGTFKKGSDPRRNMAGRPRLHDAVAGVIRGKDKGRLAEGIDRVYEKARRGDLACLEWLVSHGWGKPLVEVSGEAGGPIRVRVEYVDGEEAEAALNTEGGEG